MAVKRVRRQAQKQRKQADDRLKQLEKLYNEKLSLDAPVQYWTDKRYKHGRSTAALFALFIILILITFSFCYWMLPNTRLGDLSFWQSANLGVFALVTLSVGIVVALVRVPLRLAMSELHLKNDADERVTMVNTYLALRAGEHATTEHMQIVLERLFRPGVDGIVKDDLGSITAADVVQRAFNVHR